MTIFGKRTDGYKYGILQFSLIEQTYGIGFRGIGNEKERKKKGRKRKKERKRRTLVEPYPVVAFRGREDAHSCRCGPLVKHLVNFVHAGESGETL